MTDNKLEQAARQALEALEEIAATRYPSNWCEALHDEITALRDALAEQAVQEPVAWMCSDQRLIDMGYLKFSSVCQGVWNIPLYTRPVRTKYPCNPLQDLTDDEIYTLYSEPCSDREMVEFARAVISADRAKQVGEVATQQEKNNANHNT